MKIFLDFDRTLYDLDALHEDARKIVESHGIPRNEYDRTRGFFATKSGAPGALYTPEAHLGYFRDIDDVTRPRIVNDIRRLVRDGRRYVFEDVREFFLMPRVEDESIILTFGDDGFQREKIHGSGLESGTIIVTTGDKWDAIADSIHQGESTVFIDDHEAYFSRPVAVPSVTGIHLVRNGACESSVCHAHFHAHNFCEIAEFLSDKY